MSPLFSSVLIVDQNESHKGILTNAAFVLGLSAGRLMKEESFGTPVVDGDGFMHAPLTNHAHFVRKAGQSKLRTLRELFTNTKGVTVIDYTIDAATSNYSEYEALLGNHKGEEIEYRAIHVFGPEDIIKQNTKNLSRLE